MIKDDVQPTDVNVPSETIPIPPKTPSRPSTPSSPKTTKLVWFKVRMEYEEGSYKSVRELGDKYGINENTLHSRIRTEKWREKKEKILVKAQARVEMKVLSELEFKNSYLKNSFLRAKGYEKLIDVSKENLGSKTSDGTPVLDPEAIEAYTRSELRIHELAKSALRISDKAEVDIKSGGVSIGESFLQAITKLRESNLPKLTEEDLKAVLEMEVIPDK